MSDKVTVSVCSAEIGDQFERGNRVKFQESCLEFERLVTAQCEALIQAIRDRREFLLEAIHLDKESKIRILKEQQMSCTGKLQQTTGLIQFCIEALKETDSAAFLQVSESSKLILSVSSGYTFIRHDNSILKFRLNSQSRCCLLQ